MRERDGCLADNNLLKVAPRKLLDRSRYDPLLGHAMVLRGFGDD
jgi:hypothetical protein